MLHYTMRHPVPEVYRDYALDPSTCRTIELTPAGAKDVAREAELQRSSGVVCYLER